MFVAIVAIWVLAEWRFGWPKYSAIYSGSIAMKFITAVLFLWSLVAVWTHNWMNTFSSSMIIFISIVVMEFPPGISPESPDTIGVPSIVTTTMFCVVAMATVGRDTKQLKSCATAGYIAITVTGLIIMLGYLFSFPKAYFDLWGMTPVAFLTACCFTCLGTIGLLRGSCTN